ncbi:MAG: DUF2520 domain-containing protein [Actinobacteria bacterium]|nr:DUF2520 domain-containing protein [Actinomycetota bacterium]
MDIALVGPGRAGTAVALACVAAGHRVVAVAGRTPDAESTRIAAARFEARVVPVQFAGRGARLVLIATPDDAIEATAAALAQSLEPEALVVHLSGSHGLAALASITATRSDVAVGAVHPLQTLPSPDSSLAGAWAAVAGPAEVTDLAATIGLRPFTVDDACRATYHAAAVVASNHVVALIGQVERLASAAGAPFEAFEPLATAALQNSFAQGPKAALTGPVARGDVETVRRHLASIPSDEQAAYRALASAAQRLTGRDASEPSEVLG